ncbi:phospholipase D-like domain-containing protein [Anaerotignum sp. MB30-C6]|uniref:phospholipase D-like domain-containing protein n=1 Tax=Anaerotignum sp. MB30-C6 TaxID=3070814 RepID=UPI0027DE1D07|nr:phospholipase D-like domain-containing protein [Anaerotignum sp. MB30-C6]WMI81975.1 phospholipase D-like domain-containing protein [Anaerotignum sp. MB30-C6]
MHRPKKRNVPGKVKNLIILLGFAVPIFISFATKNPEGTSFTGEYYPAEELSFIHDLSYQKEGETVQESNILLAELDLIANAKEYLILDLFLFNDEYDRAKGSFPNSVEQITEALIVKKQENPEMPIVLITDPINNFYGAYEQRNITRLKKEGIQVVLTDLDQMKDSNPLYSGFYRSYLQWFGTQGEGWLPNFFDPTGPKVHIRSILKLANLKGNHRKTLVSEKEAIVTSANPHDPSSYHSNVAVRFRGNVVGDLIESEKNVIAFSSGQVPEITYQKNQTQGLDAVTKVAQESVMMRLITERGIFDALLENIEGAKEGDAIWIGIFYLSDVPILKALGEAAERGVQVRIIADPNKDAFGIEKNGSPNRPALCSLVDKHEGVEVRWYNTHGEQYHVKMAYFVYPEKNEARGILGSSNFTRRNLEGYNLETDVELVMAMDATLSVEMKNYFEKIYYNKDGEYTLPIDDYCETSFMQNILWKIQESLGLCSW